MINLYPHLIKKSESLTYGFAPLLWGMLTYSQVRLYSSSLALAIQLSVIACFYSLFVLTNDLVSKNKLLQRHRSNQRGVVENDETLGILQKLLTVKDIIRDPRYLVLSLVTFLKIWFSLRLVKTIDGMGSFLFLCYADTFVTQIVDIVMQQLRDIQVIDSNISQASEDIEQSVTQIGGESSKEMPVAFNLVASNQSPAKQKETFVMPKQCSGTQFIGIFIWSMAVLLHLICVGSFTTWYKLILYLSVCGVEIYVLKYLIVDEMSINMAQNVAEQPYGKFLSVFLQKKDLSLWSRPIDMDIKENKMTYQKSRIFLIVLFAIIDQIYETFKYMIFGTSDLEIVMKTDKSMTVFVILVAIMIYRQKFELQVLRKYDLETLNFGKIFFLPTFFVTFCLSEAAFSKKSGGASGLLFVHLIFMIAYFHFFWEKGCRTLGINQLASISGSQNSTQSNNEVMPLFKEDGGINFDTLRLYFSQISGALNLEQSQNWLLVDIVMVTWKNEQSKKILIFFTINMAFMFVELLYGYWTNSLGLMSDAFHMLFDCTALLIGLLASYVAQMKKSDNEYTYGYCKIETISGLFNGIFLVFISYNIFCESVERIFSPIKINDNGLITVSILGLIVNMIGLIFFHEFHNHGGEECTHSHGTAVASDSQTNDSIQNSTEEDHDQEQDHAHNHSHGGSECSHSHDSKVQEDAVEEVHSHAHENENMHGIFLHILADALGSVGVIISSVLVKYYDLQIADPICSSIISVLIFASVLPLLKSSSETLLLKSPSKISKNYVKIINEIQDIDQVREVKEFQNWTLSKGEYVASVRVIVREENEVMKNDEDEDLVGDQVRSILKNYGIENMTIDIEVRQNQDVGFPSSQSSKEKILMQNVASLQQIENQNNELKKVAKKGQKIQ